MGGNEWYDVRKELRILQQRTQQTKTGCPLQGLWLISVIPTASSIIAINTSINKPGFLPSPPPFHFIRRRESWQLARGQVCEQVRRSRREIISPLSAPHQQIEQRHLCLLIWGMGDEQRRTYYPSHVLIKIKSCNYYIHLCWQFYCHCTEHLP